MKVALVTTWGQDCGIATYSEELAEAAPEGLQFYALGPEEARGDRTLPQVPERRAWCRGDTQLAMRLLPLLEGCDVVHFQHEFGLFPHAWPFIGAVRELRKRLPVVVTLHTAYPYGEARWTTWADALCQSASAVVVHTASAMAAVGCARGGALLRHLPHGTRIVSRGEARHGLATLRVEEGVSVGLALGFVGIGKNLICTVRAFAEAKARRLLPESALFCVVGAGDPQYSGLVRGTMTECGGDLNFRYVAGFLPSAEVRHVMAAATYGILNTVAWSLSASGAAHVLAGHGVPFACASRPIYEEGIAAGAVPFSLRPDNGEPDISLINAIAALARPGGAVAATVRESVMGFAHRTRWESVAQRHLKLYEEVVDAHRK